MPTKNHKPIFGFYHIAIINEWKLTVEEQIQRISQSGLGNITETIYVGVVGGKLNIKLPENYIVMYEHPKIKRFEFPTLKRLQDFCINKDENCLIWYIHTKGVSQKRDTPFFEKKNNKRLLMEAEIIDRHKICMKLLQNHDACGRGMVRPTGKEKGFLKNARYFDGNFWWANSDYIKRLPYVNHHRDIRHYAEVWIGKGNGKLFDTRADKTCR